MLMARHPFGLIAVTRRSTGSRKRPGAADISSLGLPIVSWAELLKTECFCGVRWRRKNAPSKAISNKSAEVFGAKFGCKLSDPLSNEDHHHEHDQDQGRHDDLL
jgi:hypothetical protein